MVTYILQTQTEQYGVLILKCWVYVMPIVNFLRWNNTPSQNGIPLIKTIFFFFLKEDFIDRSMKLTHCH